VISDKDIAPQIFLQ